MRARSGFSLIEALVVLAIGGMALAIIFSIGTRAGDTGFKLGRGAMAAADKDVAFADVRTVLRSYLLRPPATFLADGDTPIVGEQNRLTGEVVMRRATPCAPQGWAGRLTLVIEPFEGGRRLSCEANGRRTPLLILPRGSGRFSYSTDGADWNTRYSNDPAGFDAPTETTYVQVFIRLEAGLDDVDIVEGLSSGPLGRWVRDFGQL